MEGSDTAVLAVFDNFEKLDFPALMEVYAEGNLENGEYFWPEETPERRMALAKESFRDYLVNGFFGTAHGTYYVWTEEGRYLSALRLEEHENGLLLGALETRLDCRKLGYAKRLISAVLHRLPKGTRVYSHVSKGNEPSLATHLACGFVKELDHSVDQDGEICDDEVTMEVIV